VTRGHVRRYKVAWDPQAGEWYAVFPDGTEKAYHAKSTAIRVCRLACWADAKAGKRALLIVRGPHGHIQFENEYNPD
jgi:hypothetical protein